MSLAFWRLILDEKAYRVGRANFRRLQRRAQSNPRLAAAIAQGRIEAVDARGRRLTTAQSARRELRDGIAKPPKGARLFSVQARDNGGTVRAHLADRNGVVQTSWAKLRHRRGRDFITEYGPGDRGVVRADIFKDTYQRVGGDNYRKNPSVRLGAFVNRRARTIRTLEGPVRANRGDMIMVGTRGEMWPVRRNKFRDKYRVTR